MYKIDIICTEKPVAEISGVNKSSSNNIGMYKATTSEMAFDNMSSYTNELFTQVVNMQKITKEKLLYIYIYIYIYIKLYISYEDMYI